jgi:hypothetical protein
VHPSVCMQSRYAAAIGMSGGEDRYAVGVHLKGGGVKRTDTRVDQKGEDGVARGCAQGREWVGLNDASPLAWRC